MLNPFFDSLSNKYFGTQILMVFRIVKQGKTLIYQKVNTLGDQTKVLVQTIVSYL